MSQYNVIEFDKRIIDRLGDILDIVLIEPDLIISIHQDSQHVRRMVFNGPGQTLIQGAINLDDPDYFEQTYQSYIWDIYRQSIYPSVLCLGLGAGIFPNRIISRSDVVTVIELHEPVLGLARKWFDLDDRIEVIIDDATTQLNMATDLIYDLIIVDLFDQIGSIMIEPELVKRVARRCVIWNFIERPPDYILQAFDNADIIKTSSHNYLMVWDK